MVFTTGGLDTRIVTGTVSPEVPRTEILTEALYVPTGSELANIPTVIEPGVTPLTGVILNTCDGSDP